VGAHEQRMRSTPRRLLVALVIAVSLLVILGLLFTILVFNPFEGKLESIASIVPKGVAFYALKPEPGSDVQRFLDSSFLSGLQASPSFQAFLESETFRELDEAYSIRSNLEQLLALPEKAPIDVYAELLGSESALAGFPRDDKITRWDFLLFTRVGWKVRAGVDWSASDLVTSRLARDVSIRKMPVRGFEVTLLVVANKPKLLEETLNLGEQGAGLSLQNDVEFRRARAGRPEEAAGSGAPFYADLAKLRSEFDLDRRLERASFDPLYQVALQVLTPLRMRSMAGGATPSDPPRLEVTFHYEDRPQSGHARRIASAEPVEIAAMQRLYADFVPAGDFFFGFVKCPATDLFALMSTQFSPADRQLIDENLRRRKTNLDEFLARTASHFGDELAISLSRIPYSPAEMPHKPFPAITLYFQIADPAGLDGFLHFLTDEEFAIEEVEQRTGPGGITYFRGAPKLPIISWAKDQIAYATVGDRWLLSSREETLLRVLRVHAREAGSLFDTPAWQRTVEALGPRANAFGFLQAQSFLDWAGDFSSYLAEKSATISRARWVELRAEKEQQVRRERPGIGGDELDEIVDRMLLQYEKDWQRNQVPRALRAYSERITWARAASGLTAGILFRPDQTDLRLALDFAFER
jgi:hypothetical protein